MRTTELFEEHEHHAEPAPPIEVALMLLYTKKHQPVNIWLGQIAYRFTKAVYVPAGQFAFSKPEHWDCTFEPINHDNLLPLTRSFYHDRDMMRMNNRPVEWSLHKERDDTGVEWRLQWNYTDEDHHD